MKSIAVITVGRSDYGIYRPVLRRIREESSLRLGMIVSGTHLEPAFGRTEARIEADGFPIRDRVPLTPSEDEPASIAESMGRGVSGFARAYAGARPDLLVVLGDRYEMAAAALAALPFKIPVAHIHGGELTRGAFDDALRHAITKTSHLHFVATGESARRVVQMGEEPWRVTISGAPSLDSLRDFRPLPGRALETLVGLPLDRPPLLVTLHPVTLEYERTDRQVEDLLAALEVAGLPILFTLPNADTRGRVIRERVLAFVRTHPGARAVEALGTEAYFSFMAVAAAMVGNSSSGILEAASFRLPVVDVGARQEGRLRPANVIHCDDDRQAIGAALKQALSPGFRDGLRGLINPYGDGNAAPRIVDRLVTAPLDDRLLQKRFFDLPVPPDVRPDGRGGP